MTLAALAALSVAVAAEPEPTRAIDLPEKAQKLRDAGVKPDDVRSALDAIRGADLRATEAAEVLDESAEAVKENGNIDNFGSFVTEQVKSGLRGKELADAIHAEHEARGMGKGNGKGKGKDKDKGPKGDDDDDGEGAEDGDDPGKGKGKAPTEGGKPDGAGKPADADKGGKPEKGAKGKGGGK